MVSRWGKGSITIYTTMAFTVIIALILVLTESARIYSSKALTMSKLSMSCESVLADYDRDIYKNYHIFAYDGGNNDEQAVKDKIRSAVEGYICVDGTEWQDDFNKVSLDNLSISNLQWMTDDQGEVFINEAVEYMKYKTTADISTQFLEMLGLLNNSKKNIEVIKCKAAVESKIYDCQDMLLELTTQIDGLYCEYDTYARKDNGDLIICDSFAKLIVVNQQGKESVGINNEFVYGCIKDSYYDVEKEMDKLLINLSWLKDNFKKYDEKSDKIFDECQDIIYTVEEKSKSCLNSIDISLAFIDKLKKDATEIELELKTFNDKLSASQKELDKDVYEELRQENEELLKQPLSNIGKIEERLRGNKKIIEELSQIYNCGYQYSEKGIEKAYDYVTGLRKSLEGYRVDDICFDYSGIKREIPQKADASMKGLKAIISEGIARICISNYDKLSNSRLKDSGLVSEALKDKASSSLSKSIEKLITSPKDAMYELVDNLMEAFEDEMSVEDLLSKTSSELMEEVLFSYYIGENFTSLTNTGANKDLTHSLAYEQEYIIIGERSDRANVKGIVNKLLGIRMLINYICILSDGGCRAQAHTVSTSLTGFLGMPAVTYLVSTIIQIIWAYEEAVVDVCAITNGRYVPLIKTSAALKVQAATICIFSKPTIENLSKQYSDTDSPTDFGYDEYLKLFIMLQDDDVAAARTMDLIQSNINRNYNKKINFSRLIFGWEVDAVFNMKGIFTETIFVQSFIKDKKYGKYQLMFSYGCSY